MIRHSELLFTLDVSVADAPREARRLRDFLVARGWITPALEPGPRAFATGAVNEKQGGRAKILAGPVLNMQGVGMEGPLCPYCNHQMELEHLVDVSSELSSENPYPIVACKHCGRDVAYADWIGTAHPIMSNLTLELDAWMVFQDDPASPPLLAEIREEMGGRWIHMWFHF
jgi:hypothetical protein